MYGQVLIRTVKYFNGMYSWIFFWMFTFKKESTDNKKRKKTNIQNDTACQELK